MQNLIKGSIADDTKINSSVFKESQKKKATENIYKLPLYENVAVEKLSEYSDCVIIYTKSNINLEVEAIIKQYNTIPSEIQSRGVNFLSCKINNVVLTIDPNCGNSYT